MRNVRRTQCTLSSTLLIRVEILIHFLYLIIFFIYIFCYITINRTTIFSEHIRKIVKKTSINIGEFPLLVPERHSTAVY